MLVDYGINAGLILGWVFKKVEVVEDVGEGWA